MSLFTAEEDADLIAEIEDELVDFSSVYRPGAPANSALGYTQTFTLLDVVQCKYAPQRRPLKGTELVEAEGVVERLDIIVTMPAHTDVTERDRLVLQVTATGEILDLEVLGVKSTTREMTRQAACQLYR